MPRILTSVLSLFFIFTQSLSAQYIDKIITKSGNALLKNKAFNAVSIGVYKEGKQYIQHFGVLTKGGNDAPTDETIYEIASVTKTFTGYLIAKAVLEDKLSLDDEVQIYLEGDFSNLAFEGKQITIRDIITHTAGLPHFMDKRMTETFAAMQADVPTSFFNLEQALTEELFFEYLAAYELTAAPGTKYSYSNAGAELMGYILTKVYKKSFDQLLQEALLTDLGMNDTAIRLNEMQQQRLTQGYWLKNTDKSPNQLNPLWATGSGLKSTLPDLMKYIEFYLNSDDPIIKESQTILYEKETRWVSYFWNTWKDKHGTSYNHHGGTSGMQNYIFLFPKYDLGFSIIVNHSDAKAPREMSSAISRMLKAVIK